MEFLERGFIRDRELHARRSDGQTRLLKVSGERVSLAGEDYFVGLAEDVTERRRIEEQLRARQRLDAIGTLAGGIAHDFNNLLVVILNYTDFALQALSPGDRLHADLTEVRLAAERAAQLTRQLLAFGRRQALQPVALGIPDVVHGLEPMLRRIVGEDVECVVRCERDTGTVVADAGQIEQVIVNLIANARDAMPAGGRLVVATCNVDHAPGSPAPPNVEPGRFVELLVTDSGVGMDEATRAQAFEPFFTTKSPGHGTSVHVWLPRTDLPRAEPAPHVERLAPGGHETILVVEDEPALLALAQRVLESSGYRVHVAADGPEAIALAGRLPQPADLLLTDVVMPRMGGRQVAEAVRELWPGVRVLYMSGHTDESITRQGVLHPGVELLAKPFSALDLLARVRGLLDLATDDSLRAEPH